MQIYSFLAVFILYFILLKSPLFAFTRIYS